MKRISWIAMLVLALSANLAACVKEATPEPSSGTPALPTPPATPPGGNNQTPDSSQGLRITIGGQTRTATLADNATASAFRALLPLTLRMRDLNNNEKVCSLPRSLTTEAVTPGIIHTGDIMLYGSSSLVLFYETFPTSYPYTHIGRVDNPSELKAVLGAGDVTIKFEEDGDK